MQIIAFEVVQIYYLNSCGPLRRYGTSSMASSAR